MNLDALFGTTALALGDVLDHLGLFGSQVRATWRSPAPAAAGPGDEDGGGAPIGEPDDDDDEDDEEPMQLRRFAVGPASAGQRIATSSPNEFRRTAEFMGQRRPPKRS